MSVSFVLGNGVSREPIDLTHLKNQNYGPIYGCNALYRHFKPDYLVAVDVKMILEINNAQYQYENQVWTNPNKAYNGFRNLNYFQPSKGWSSGPTALWLASQHMPKEIYILGFDFHGVEDEKGMHSKVNNLYAGTHNYKKKGEPATYYGNWERQTATTMMKFPHIRYIRVVADKDDFIPKHLKKVNNLEHITVSDFKKYWKFP